MPLPEPVAGILLAGGMARRMGGGDKCLRQLGGRPLLEWVAGRARPQIDALVLNANGDPARFAGFGLPVVRDVIEGFAGPLAGILTGMEWVRIHAPDCQWLASFATDAPFFPDDLVERFMAVVKEDKADMACARSNGRMHPVFALWPVALAEDLRRAMVEEDIRKVDAWTSRYRLAVADFPVEPLDPFFNVNRLEDLEAAEDLIKDKKGR